MLVDLHLHSTASDGLLSPAALVVMAKAAGLDIIALTDHDTTAGLEEARAAGASCGLRVISGIEFSTELDSAEVHILGFQVDHQHQGLHQLLEKIRLSRLRRIEQMIDRLRDLGFDLTWDEVASGASNASSLGRPHVARVMVNKGYVASVKEAFDHWLDRGRKAYVPRFKLHPAEAIAVIHESGGLAFLAHPGLLPANSIIAQVAAMGLDGLEAFHPQHSPEQIQAFLLQAETLALHISAGSDFHGGPGEPELGAAAVDLTLPWLMD
ncbi:MAG: PHP domain-containing protein [Bacillota bacterium]|jgi:predicted metal-dependent phosphoesterase TrpH|nr:PHP domain-containing protein [Bacillota bacterium]